MNDTSSICGVSSLAVGIVPLIFSVIVPITVLTIITDTALDQHGRNDHWRGLLGAPGDLDSQKE